VQETDSWETPSKKGSFRIEKCTNKKVFFLVLVLMFVTLAYLNFGNDSLFGEVVLGTFLAMLGLMMALLFGYTGLAVSFVFNCVCIVSEFFTWSSTGDTYYLGVILYYLMNLIASAVVAWKVETEKQKNKELVFLSVTDGLTGVYNHRYFRKRLDEELALALRNNYELGLCMVDIDQFKLINDTKGHSHGDQILLTVARLLEELTRKSDVVFRYGGDEFAIILPNTNAAGVRRVMERVKAEFQKVGLRYSDFDPSSLLTMSAGYSVFPYPAGNKEELVCQADRALYYAKSMGRDRIDFFSDVFGHVAHIYSMEGECGETMRSLLLGVSSKDNYTMGHSERVANYALVIGKAIGMTGEDLKLLRIAALLHDIGKIETPDMILNKTGKLTEEEYRIIKEHPERSAAIVKKLPTISGIIEDIRHHHERYDGKGYPAGISKKEIPLGARIIAVADAFDAMRSDRPYRNGLNLGDAVRELREGAGSQFDPELVQVFLKCFSGQAAV